MQNHMVCSQLCLQRILLCIGAMTAKVLGRSLAPSVVVDWASHLSSGGSVKCNAQVTLVFYFR